MRRDETRRNRTKRSEATEQQTRTDGRRDSSCKVGRVDNKPVLILEDLWERRSWNMEPCVCVCVCGKQAACACAAGAGQTG